MRGCTRQAKWEIIIQDGISVVESAKSLDIFNKNSGYFLAMLEGTNWNIFDVTSGQFPAMFVATKQHNLIFS